MTISVVIPAYNGARYIEEAIRSILCQERQPDEIIVYDDGSTDGTVDICRKYDGKVVIYTHPDGPSGFVNGWNSAIGFARSEYICILHQDDVLAPGFIRMGMEALERNPGVRHLFCTCRYIDEAGETAGFSFEGGGGEKKYTGREYFFSYQRMGRPHIHRCAGVITHRSIFEECRYAAAAGHIADDDFFYRVGMFTDVIGIHLPLASFRIHGESATGVLDDAALAGRLMDDYIYQCRQWKGHPFVDEVGYDWFVRRARKYIRRWMGYGVRRRNVGMIIMGIRRWVRLKAPRG